MVVPRFWQDWVLDRGSLTKRLIQHSKGNFRVRIKQQQWARPSLSERRVLKLKDREFALIREVELLCNEEVTVRARSVIPLATLCGEERALAHLGTKPLGAFLFASRVMRRSPLELSKSLLPDGEQCFTRRSLFYLRSKPILVNETFLPVLLER